MLVPRPKTRANQRHNSLSRQSVSITAHSLSPANGHPTHEEVQYEAQILALVHIPFSSLTVEDNYLNPVARWVNDMDMQAGIQSRRPSQVSYPMPEIRSGMSFRTRGAGSLRLRLAAVKLTWFPVRGRPQKGRPHKENHRRFGSAITRDAPPTEPSLGQTSVLTLSNDNLVIPLRIA